MSRRWIPVGALVIGMGVAGLTCPGDEKEGSGDAAILGDAAGAVTYTNGVKALLDKNCTKCHAATKTGADRHGSPPDVNLDTYAGLKMTRPNGDGANETVAVEANDEIQTGGMPVDDNDQDTGGLPALDRATFQAWIDNGLKE